MIDVPSVVSQTTGGKQFNISLQMEVCTAHVLNKGFMCIGYLQNSKEAVNVYYGFPLFRSLFEYIYKY